MMPNLSDLARELSNVEGQSTISQKGAQLIESKKKKSGTLSDLAQEFNQPTQTPEQRAKLAGEMTHEAKPKEKVPSRAEKELPELGRGGLLYGEDKVKVAEITPMILLTPNTREIANMLQTTFKNVSITEDENGNLIAIFLIIGD